MLLQDGYKTSNLSLSLSLSVIGHSGFSVSTVNRVHVFKPVSVQAMWWAAYIVVKKIPLITLTFNLCLFVLFCFCHPFTLPFFLIIFLPSSLSFIFSSLIYQSCLLSILIAHISSLSCLILTLLFTWPPSLFNIFCSLNILAVICLHCVSSLLS